MPAAMMSVTNSASASASSASGGRKSEGISGGAIAGIRSSTGHRLCGTPPDMHENEEPFQ
jgi:hypothetical protein